MTSREKMLPEKQKKSQLKDLIRVSLSPNFV